MNEALAKAIRAGDEKEVRRLVTRENVDARDERGKTALHLAAYYKLGNIVALLLEKGADIMARDEHGFLPLNYIERNCTRQKDWEVMDCLCKEATRRLFDVLHNGDNEDAAYQLAKYSGANILYSNPEMFGNTALHYAAKHGFMKLATFLLNSGAKIDVANGAGRTAFLEALTEKHEEMAKFLMREGANLDGGLQIAVDRELKDMVKLLSIPQPRIR